MLKLDMASRDYDAIVVGASFGGLAVARQLRGDVLLLDRNEVGAVQTSACGTPLWVPETLGVARASCRSTTASPCGRRRRTVTYDLSAVPFCTFDYRVFCQGLLAQCQRALPARRGDGVRTGAVVDRRGRLQRPVIVDCSGWRRALVSAGAPGRRRRAHSFGLETHAPLPTRGSHSCWTGGSSRGASAGSSRWARGA